MGSQYLLFFLFILLASCSTDDRESNGPIFCTIDQTETYAIGTDPSVDFDVSNLVKTTSFNEVTCQNVSSDSFSVPISRVKRVATKVSIIEREISGPQFLLEMIASGTTLLPVQASFNISGCTIKTVWTGTVDIAGTTITVNENITYKGACESVFKDQE